jgi:hypothetical protein
MSYTALHRPTGRTVEVGFWCPNYAVVIDQGIESVVDPVDLLKVPDEQPPAFEVVGGVVVDTEPDGVRAARSVGWLPTSRRGFRVRNQGLEPLGD